MEIEQELQDSKIIVLPSRSSYFHSTYNPFTYSPKSSSFINGVLIVHDKNLANSVNFSYKHEKRGLKVDGKTLANYPLIFGPEYIIKIPTKVEYVLRRYTPAKLLKAVHPNRDAAVEMCLLFTTNLTSLYFKRPQEAESGTWKALNAKYLRSFFSTSPSTYTHVINALVYPLREGSIIECDRISKKGSKSYGYRFGQNYFKKGIITYQLKTNEAKHLWQRHNLRLLESAWQNPICRNLMNFYSLITLPTMEEVKQEGSRLVKGKVETKKGKRLATLNRHSKNYYKKSKNVSFIEDGIKRFRGLTENGLMIPRPGNEASGGRVVDSITLMPGWIRNLIKINGRRLLECDYSCLHPNIGMTIYGGRQDFITHRKLATALGIQTGEVKNNHLSFFNRRVKHMEKSSVYEYYKQHEPEMLKRIEKEKFKSIHGHKVTSRKLFSKEVQIMTNVINQLNRENIFVGYIYDALLCEAKSKDRVLEIMNSTVLAHNVKTEAKCSLNIEDDFKKERAA